MHAPEPFLRCPRQRDFMCREPSCPRGSQNAARRSAHSSLTGCFRTLSLPRFFFWLTCLPLLSALSWPFSSKLLVWERLHTSRSLQSVALSGPGRRPANHTHFVLMFDFKRYRARRPSLLILLVLLFFGGPLLCLALTRQLLALTFIPFLRFTMGRMIGLKTETNAAKHTPIASGHSPAPGETEATPCPICQEPVGSPSPEGTIEGWSVLPCGHRFGSRCIKYYLGLVADERPSCPICRLPAHHRCDHPVLPALLDAHKAGPQKNIPAEERAVGTRKAQATLCGYCLVLDASGRRYRKPTARWKTPIRWLVQRLTTRRTNRSNGLDDDGVWRGPWVDKWPRPRDPEWERWWNGQAPCGA